MNYRLITFALTSIAISLPTIASAAEYFPMVKLPFISNANGSVSLETFVPGIYKLAVGVASVLAVIMITLAGFKYMTSEGGKSEAKESIRNALLGMLLLLNSYLLLNTINPELLKVNIDFGGGPAVSADFRRAVQLSTSYSGFTSQLVKEITAAQVEYNRLMANGQPQEAAELYYNATAAVNFQKALNLAGGSASERLLAERSITNMNALIDEHIEEKFSNYMEEDIPALEAKKLYNNITFNQQSKAVLLTKSAGTGTTASNDLIRNQITILQSESNQTYEQLREKDPVLAETYKQQAASRVTQLNLLIKN